MTDKKPPSPRKRPQQGRSLLLVNAIQEACLIILRDEGPDQLSTQRIADVAGVNIASVYQYFPNKEAVLANVYNEVLQQQADKAAQHFVEFQELSKLSLEKTLAAFIDLEAEQLLALYKLNPGFYSEYCHSYDIHGAVDEITQARHNPSWEAWFPQFLECHKTRLRSVDVNTMSFIVRNTLRGNLQAAIDDNPLRLEDDEFRAELLYLLLAYLLVQPDAVS